MSGAPMPQPTNISEVSAAACAAGQAVGGLEERHAPQARRARAAGRRCPGRRGRSASVWRCAQHLAEARQHADRARRCRAACRAPWPTAASASAKPPPASISMAVRQSEASTSEPQRRLAEHAARHAHGHGEAPRAWQSGAAENHCPAIAMAPTRLKAAEAPIRKRPGGGRRQRIAGGKQHAAGAADEGGNRHQPARPEAVEQQRRPGSACRHSRRSRRRRDGPARRRRRRSRASALRP